MKLRYTFLTGVQGLPFSLERICAIFVVLAVVAAFVSDESILSALMGASFLCALVVTTFALIRGWLILRHTDKSRL